MAKLNKTAKTFILLWHMDITVVDNKEPLSLDACTGKIIGVTEDEVKLRVGNIMVKWISFIKPWLEFHIKDD